MANAVGNKTRKVMIMIDKHRWVMWSKDGREMLYTQQYANTIELRIGKAEVPCRSEEGRSIYETQIAIVWRNMADNNRCGWCITGNEADVRSPP